MTKNNVVDVGRPLDWWSCSDPHLDGATLSLTAPLRRIEFPWTGGSVVAVLAGVGDLGGGFSSTTGFALAERPAMPTTELQCLLQSKLFVCLSTTDLLKTLNCS